MQINEKLSVLSNITQTTIWATPKKKINNIIKWSKNSKNWYGGIIWQYKPVIKNLNHFNKVVLYMFANGHISHIVSNNYVRDVPFVNNVWHLFFKNI